MQENEATQQERRTPGVRHPETGTDIQKKKLRGMSAAESIRMDRGRQLSQTHKTIKKRDDSKVTGVKGNLQVKKNPTWLNKKGQPSTGQDGLHGGSTSHSEKWAGRDGGWSLIIYSEHPFYTFLSHNFLKYLRTFESMARRAHGSNRLMQAEKTMTKAWLLVALSYYLFHTLAVLLGFKDPRKRQRFTETASQVEPPRQRDPP